MERKRKLPARAAARSEQAAKRRQAPPREPSEPPAPTPPPVEHSPSPPPPLPHSIEAGKPLPTIEDTQPENLSTKEYQTVLESGVLSESLSRSRHKWISEGLFEKYWTKPHKRKGVLIEDPKNPPKDTMHKVGTVTITIEPHILEATMYAVKGPKSRPQQQTQSKQDSVSSQQPQQHQPTPQIKSEQQQESAPLPSKAQTSQQSQTQQPQQQGTSTKVQSQEGHPSRPVLQYGPANGSMPPPPTPSSAVATPTATPTATTFQPTKSSISLSPAQGSLPSPTLDSAAAQTRKSPGESPGPPIAPQTATPAAASGSSKAVPAQKVPQPTNQPNKSPSTTTAATPAGSASASRPPSGPPLGQALAPSPAAQNRSTATSGKSPAKTTTGGTLTAKPAGQTSAPPSPAPAKPTVNDPVIALLAQRASGDAELRDLMKRVAVGQAKDGELAHFQKIIDQLNIECKQKAAQQGPPADKLLVDGRTVKYFADEVRTILDIVLTSNPNQKSSELRPPPRSDPLVVLLVKTALEDQRTKDIIRRIAEGRPGSTDPKDLKEILDRLHRDAKTIPQGKSTSATPAKQTVANGVPNGHTKTAAAQGQHQSNAQPIRSKAPPAPPKPDISAVVFDFGTGDRYLFPKYSILEYLSTKSGQQVVASFLIVRKGSISEYGGNPELDYYQPVTIRLQTNTGRHLENLARAVAPQDEVRRYMDDVMDNMTRAEYVLLAMRLPRAVKDGDDGAVSMNESQKTSPTPKDELETDKSAPFKPGVLWTSGGGVVPPSGTALPGSQRATKFRDAEQESQEAYDRLIRSVAAKHG